MVGKEKALVVIGGSSSVGQYAIQLARLSGFSRIATNASPANIGLLQSLGAHVVLDRTQQSRPEDFQAALEGVPLAGVVDCISAQDTGLLGIKIVRLLGGTDTLVRVPANMDDVLSLVAGDGGVVEPEMAKLARTKGEGDQTELKLKGIVGIGSAPYLRYLSEPWMNHLGGTKGYIAKGLFIPNRPVVVANGLRAIDEALEKNKKGVSGEKVVVRPFD